MSAGRNEPYYPLPQAESRRATRATRRRPPSSAARWSSRAGLAEYRYYDMDQAVAHALTVFRNQIADGPRRPCRRDVGIGAASMRILHVGWGYPPAWMGCGPVVYVHTLALAQAEAGDQPMVVCASDRSAEGRPPFDPVVAGIDGIPYVHLQNRPSHMHDKWNPLREALRSRAAPPPSSTCSRRPSPDVVHVHNLVGLSFDVIGAAKRFGARVVTSLHNYFPDLQPRRPVLRRRRALRRPARALVLELPRNRPGRRPLPGAPPGRGGGAQRV